MRKKSRIFTDYVPSLIGMVVVAILMMSPVGVGSAESRPEAGAKDEISLRIIYSGGLKGNIEPCG